MNQRNEPFAALLRNLDAETHQEIRDAYYKAMEGLHALAEAAELADAKQTITAGPLLDEHFIALEALAAMKQSKLGRYM